MKLPVTSLGNFCQKRSVKLLAIVKEVYNRILASSACLEMVGNELTLRYLEDIASNVDVLCVMEMNV
jgi:hypothetical protein